MQQQYGESARDSVHMLEKNSEKNGSNNREEGSQEASNTQVSRVLPGAKRTRQTEAMFTDSQGLLTWP